MLRQNPASLPVMCTLMTLLGPVCRFCTKSSAVVLLLWAVHTSFLWQATAALAIGTTPAAKHIKQFMPSVGHSNIVQSSIPARYCLEGRSLEGGLCYHRCRPGWNGLACTCWKGKQSYYRGCGVRPRICQARSYRQQRLPQVHGNKEPFSLVLSADPQLFRVVSNFKNVSTAMNYNMRLVQSINNVTQLQQWPWEAGGGAVQQPMSLVMLGDMTEYYQEDEVDAFRHLYDPSMPADEAVIPAGAKVQLPTWMMFGNHDIVNNVHRCRFKFKELDSNACARIAVDTMRAVLTPGCDDTTWSSFPREAVTSFDAGSMAYSFDYDNWHFVVLQYSPRYSEPSLALKSSMGWLAAELSSATAQQRRIVLLIHSHRDLGLSEDPTFARLVNNSNVVAIFYGHVHVRPWGLTGSFPGTNVPMFNCGASWHHVFCYAEFGQDRFRVAAVGHNATEGLPLPQWYGSSVHLLLKQSKAKPVLQQFTSNPNQTYTNSTKRSGKNGWPALLASLLLIALFML